MCAAATSSALTSANAAVVVQLCLVMATAATPMAWVLPVDEEEVLAAEDVCVDTTPWAEDGALLLGGVAADPVLVEGGGSAFPPTRTRMPLAATAAEASSTFLDGGLRCFDCEGSWARLVAETAAAAAA
jgi:hypothetical protein